METFWLDIRFAVRMLAKNPGFTVAAVLCLMLGTGATTGIFSVVNGVALAIATVGIYGVISCSVARRSKEFGLRMALGAQPADVLGLVMKQGAGLALLGVAAGLIAAFALTRLMTSLLFGVTPTDPVTFISVTLLLAVVALAACYVPARRATKVDPITTLRYE
jgi:putative ABC transport system permease protein